MISSRTAGLLTTGIIASMLILVPPARAQLAQPGASTRERSSFGESLARWVDDVQNLRVREAMGELGQHWTVVVVALSIVVLLFLAIAGVFRPSGVGSTARDVKPFPSLVWLFVGLLILLVGPMAADAAVGLPALYARSTGREIELDPVQVEALRIGSASLAGVIVGLVMVYLLNKSAKDAGLKIGGMDVLIGLGCFLLAIPLVQLATIGSLALARQTMGEPPAEIAHETLQLIVDHRGHPAAWVLIIAAAVGAPIVEELVFRMGLQSALLKLFGNAWPAIIATSLVFAGIHWTVLPSNGWHALGTLFVLSLALGIAFERTKRLGVPIAMHIAFNVLNVTLAMQAADGPSRPVDRPGGTYVSAPE